MASVCAGVAACGIPPPPIHHVNTFPALCARRTPHPAPTPRPSLINFTWLSFFQDVILISTSRISPQLSRNENPRSTALSLSKSHTKPPASFAFNSAEPKTPFRELPNPSPPRGLGPPAQLTQTSKAQTAPSTPSKRPPTSNKAPRRRAPARAMAATTAAAAAVRCLQAPPECLPNPLCHQRGWAVPSHPCRVSRGRLRSR